MSQDFDDEFYSENESESISETAKHTDPAYSFLLDPSVLKPRFSDLTERAINQFLENPLNESQEVAFHKSFKDPLSLIWGPPGTGKTKVIAAIALGWILNSLQNNEPIKICIGSSNYNAIIKALRESVRAILWNQAQAALSKQPSFFLLINKNQTEKPDRVQVIEISSEERSVLLEAINSPEPLIVGGTWQQLVKLSGIHHLGNKPKRGDTYPSNWFDLLILDEASQVRVEQAAGYYLLLKERAHVVIVGDPQQLGPIRQFEMNESQSNATECVFSYYQKEFNLEPSALKVNYRSNKEITEWPKKRFYDGFLESFNPNSRLQVLVPKNRERPGFWKESFPWEESFHELLDPESPVIVVTYPSTGDAMSNSFEALNIASLAYLFWNLQEPQNQTPETFWGERAGIVTPHRAQISQIKSYLNSFGLPISSKISIVDTVEKFQGLERDLIFSSYVVADKDFIASEDKFILNPNRFNVTCTRPRHKLILFVSDALCRHLPSDREIAKDAAHLQLFVREYCQVTYDITLPNFSGGVFSQVNCKMRMPIRPSLT